MELKPGMSALVTGGASGIGSTFFSFSFVALMFIWFELLLDVLFLGENC